MSSSRAPGPLDYVNVPGDPVYPGPFNQEQTEMRGYLIPVDRERVARWAERTFTEPSGGAVRVRPTGDHAVLSVAQIGRITSQTESHRGRGHMAETDVIFWVPVDVQLGQERFAAWTMPFIFVDRAPAVATGRELYGFPKLQARFEIPESHNSGTTRVFADAIPQHRPDAEAGLHEILSLSSVPDGPGRIEATRQLSRLLTGDEGLAGLFGPGLLRELRNREIPILFLRQLRDIADPSRAIFQEILLASARHTATTGGGLIGGGWRLRVEGHDSPPVARTLGIPAAGVEADAAFWTRFDFTMELGQPLWRAATPPALALTRTTPTPPPTRRKKRIAVLGGGISALSAVFEITSHEDWQDDYDITLYQMGFRLGGKGASGRNADIADRIEEHGLHIWFGFYENAFRTIRRCYAEAGRAPGSPLATWTDAFHPHSNVVVAEQIGDRWEPWGVAFPENDQLPGDGRDEWSLADLIGMLGGYTAGLLDQAIADLAPRGETKADLAVQAAFIGIAAALRVLHRLTLEAASDPTLANSRVYRAIHHMRRRLWSRMERLVEQDTAARRIWIMLDFSLTALYGAHKDRLVERGIEAIDHLDFIEWLKIHGASDMTCRSALVRAGYDLAFAFEGGDTSRPNFAAGTGLYGYMRMLLTYKGAVMYKMQAGMGDVVFAPLYEVLRRRGVRFEFFHKVEKLELSADQRRVSSIRVAKQATLRGEEYHPLVEVKGIPCWPDRPDYAQLVEGQALRSQHIDLESGHSGWQPVDRFTLRAGQDFDQVILGIPIAACKHITGELATANPRWSRMLERVGTVCTHAVQLWTHPDRDALGWRNPSTSTQDPILGAFVEPTDTWADMTHLEGTERWPDSHRPGHISYFCGPFTDPESTPDGVDPEFPGQQRERVKARANTFLDKEIREIWPNATDKQGRFRRDLLVDLADRAPAERLEHQWIKANVEPTDRYTLSLKGTLEDRLPAGGSGFDNLFLAGDWVDNGFNAGCIEACVISGLQCARALTGWDVHVFAENPRLRPS